MHQIARCQPLACHRSASVLRRRRFAPVAQLDRAPDYESGGQEFESLRARHIFQLLSVTLWFHDLSWRPHGVHRSKIIAGQRTGFVPTPSGVDRRRCAQCPPAATLEVMDRQQGQPIKWTAVIEGKIVLRPLRVSGTLTDERAAQPTSASPLQLAFTSASPNLHSALRCNLLSPRLHPTCIVLSSTLITLVTGPLSGWPSRLCRKSSEDVRRLSRPGLPERT